MSDRYKGSDVVVRKIVETLPDDPLKATSLALTAAAIVAVSAGFDDDAAVRGLKASLQKCRDQGLGEEQH